MNMQFKIIIVIHTMRERESVTGISMENLFSGPFYLWARCFSALKKKIHNSNTPLWTKNSVSILYLLHSIKDQTTNPHCSLKSRVFFTSV